MSMPRSCLALAFTALVSLAGCGGHDTTSSGEDDQATGQPPLNPVHINRRLVQPDCRDNCATITVNSLRLDGAPRLTRQLELRQLLLAGDFNESADEAPASIREFAEHFFAQAAADHEEHPDTATYEARFEAEVVADHDDLLVIRLDDYVFRGGAHGMPTTGYMVIDQRNRHVVTLDDMLKAGQREAFNQALQAAHQRWLDSLDQPLDTGDWPFAPSDNVALLPEGAVVKYQPYAIAPYAAGQPELHIPYRELEGIFKPRYLPQDAS
ncbi:uncharacterized protein DUF4163 [Kushneria sinocarnis]|uniref:Uncharacterized protein DUF4163 n=1 Tax=Kushneria sinocarnis TaxID=595502 RepID=A0A420WWB9_9GAMM|nr:DUF3298 and DUF4163 domain-containing protein [Kushneria sinocarnis]RKR03407.1 uncharacterized protein DUF4163 [Kushneria sinocarnis]